ncbi:hypothetical protein Tco_0535329 [Tanacetum coccineum]
MRTRNSNFPNNSPVTIPRRRNRRRVPNVVEPELHTIVEVAPMAERTMEELLRAPTEGYGEAIVIPEINADHFEIKTNLLQLVQASPFHVEIVSKKVVTPATVKAVEESCVTCGSAHAWYNCPNTDNNQSSVCAATGTYNQVNPPNRVSNHMAPPGFAPVQNNGQNRFTSPSDHSNSRQNTRLGCWFGGKLIQKLRQKGVYEESFSRHAALLGEVNPVHAYYKWSCTRKDTKDPSWRYNFQDEGELGRHLQLEAYGRLYLFVFCT